MTLFSANLGFLWSELPLPDAIIAAKQAGFSAVECHWPYEHSTDDINKALNDTSMRMLSLNTGRGDVERGFNGVCAVPGMESKARLLIDEAIDFALQTRTDYVHIMAGYAQGEDAHKQFIANLNYALSKVKSYPLSLLIEPLNHFDAPNYFLSNTLQAEEIIEEVGSEQLQLIFDCYHVQLMQGNLCGNFKHHMPHIGHVQFASVPDRGPPNTGEINFPYLFEYIKRLGYAKPLGAEYIPQGSTESTLGWLRDTK